MVVLETGALVSQTETFNALLENFFSVTIEASPEEHLRPMMDQGDTRDDFKETVEDLKLILEESESAYRQADYVLNTSERTEVNCLSELRKVARAFLTMEKS